MIWTPIAASLSFASSVATFLTMLHLRVRWDVHASSVRWLFWLFFLFVCVRCVMRTIFFTWLGTQSAHQVADDTGLQIWTYGQLDRLGVRSILYLEDAKSAWLTSILCAGDLALFGIAVTLFPLTFELCQLARVSMDRGIVKEKQQIQYYFVRIWTALALYAATQLVLALVYKGYNVNTHRCLLAAYGVQILGLLYMAVQLFLLKMNGRKYETVHCVFVASPIYLRLKRIMLVYAVFALHFHLSMIVLYLDDIAPDNKIMGIVGVSLVIHNVLGVALSITTSCSQACVFSICQPCLPDNFEAEYFHRRFAEPMDDDDLEAPRANPVLVYTDIQSSSALWNLDAGSIMAEATEIHDTILRTTLLKHRGYEITTAGDAFQVAFHTMKDAVEYCMDVQLQLLVAKWPTQIHGLIPATARQRAGRRVIFQGLRVRMGIHDACEADGPLVQDVHAITGKTIYSGVSDLTAEFVGDLGSGGQILLTDRVATWLLHHRQDLSVDVFLDHVGEYTVPQVNTTVLIFQVLPTILAARAQFFPVPAKSPSAGTDGNGPTLRQERVSGRTARMTHSRAASASVLAEPDQAPQLSEYTLESPGSRVDLEAHFKLMKSPRPTDAVPVPSTHFQQPCPHRVLAFAA